MAAKTGIGWCDSTANLWIGCSKVSAACDHCYAEDLMGTQGSRLKRAVWGRLGPRVYCKSGWADSLKWQRAAERNGGVDPDLGRKRTVFINSLSDFFDNHRTVIWRDDAWATFRQCTNLVIILVTKRPQLIARYLPEFWPEIAHRVWIIVTAEDQPNADWRCRDLVEAFDDRVEPAVMGVSIEPMLGPVDLSPWLHKLKWVIVGGESGAEARPTHPRWVLDLRDQCLAAGVAFFFKQWGTWLPAAWVDKQGELVEEMAESETRGADRATALWPDGHVGWGRADDHGGDGVAFEHCSKSDRARVLGDGMVADHMLHGRRHEAFPDGRVGA
jgi:protein gp37